MKYSIQVKSISHLQRRAAEIVKDLTERCEPLLIVRNGAAKPMVIDVLSDEEQEQSTALLQMLAHGRRDIKEGRAVPVADAFAQIEAIDKEDAE